MTSKEIMKFCRENGWEGVMNEDGTITLTDRSGEEFWKCARDAGFTVTGNTISARDIYRRTKLEETDAKAFLLECAEESANSIAEEYLRDSWCDGVHPDIARILKEAEEVRGMLQKMKENLGAADYGSVFSALERTGKKYGVSVQFGFPERSTDRYVFSFPGCGVTFHVDVKSCLVKERALREIAQRIPDAAARAASEANIEKPIYIRDLVDCFICELLHEGKNAAAVIRTLAEDIRLSVLSYTNEGHRFYHIRKGDSEILISCAESLAFSQEMAYAADAIIREIIADYNLGHFSRGFIEDLERLADKIRKYDEPRIREIGEREQ